MDTGIWAIIQQVGFPIVMNCALLYILDKRLVRMLMLLSVLAERTRTRPSLLDDEDMRND